MANRKGRKPQRTCVACRQSADQDSLIRYVLAPDGQVLVDYRHKLPGRGSYTCFNKTCLESAVNKRQFQRSFHGQGVAPTTEQLSDSLLEQLAARIEGLLGMARKSGQVESGSNAVLASLRKNGKYALLILSDDISEAIGSKLKTAAIVLAAVDGDKVQLAAGVTADTTGKVKAGELVNFVAQQVGGKGGGKPDMAMAGGTEPAELTAALSSVLDWVTPKL